MWRRGDLGPGQRVALTAEVVEGVCHGNRMEGKMNRNMSCPFFSFLFFSSVPPFLLFCAQGADERLLSFCFPLPSTNFF